MTQKVSLKWLAFSSDPLAVEYRRGIGEGSSECALCCMFFGDEYEDEEGNTSKCSFDEICDDEIEHFQQMADEMSLDIEIVSLEGKTDPTREVVQFT